MTAGPLKTRISGGDTLPPDAPTTPDKPAFALEDAVPVDGAIASGVGVIRGVLRTLPTSPGVYRMLNAAGDALYVGKARNLRNRVANYTNLTQLSNRLRRMVAETARMEVVTTHTEVEALLLESNLIKTLMPRYNVLLRDDKSFPYIRLTSDHAYPQLAKHRGARTAGGEYFGPFASAGSVNRTITALHRAFLLRSCADTVFATRTRPCLQYQIKRCSAPCVGRIDKTDYALLVDEARDFLTGRSNEINQRLVARMTEAAEALDYETAALVRNRIRALAQVQAHQDINVDGILDADVIAAHQEGGQTSIQVFFFRSGQNWGNRAYFPTHDKQLGVEDVLTAFVGQFYANKPPPRLLLTSHPLAEQDLVAEALSVTAGARVQILQPQRGDKRKLLDHALTNAREALGRRLAESASQRRLLDGVATALGLATPPNRIEIYDNSHIQGSFAIGAMVVAGPDGLMKNAYRKFNIRGAGSPSRQSPIGSSSASIGAEDVPVEAAALDAAEAELTRLTPGDDYGMMREVLQRRFIRALKEDPEGDRGSWPDLIVIDGGAGQLGIACEVLAELGIEDLDVVAIAKGPDRNAGRERFFMPGRPPFSLEPKDPVLYFLQRLRDEAHRFAIGTHRAKRQKAIHTSPLDEVPGIGASRKKALLHHFGSARSVARAGLTDLEQVPGINRTVAKRIYEHFHAED
jgi:excinuclease ABC subunit C